MTRSGRLAERYPGFGVFVVGLGTLVVPFDSSVNVAFPHIIRGFDLAIPAIDRGAELPRDAGVPPIVGCRERAAAFVRVLEGHG